MSCQAPNIPNLTLLDQKQTYEVGDRAMYKCNEGYVAKGNYLTCESPNTWSNVTCNLIDCGDPGEVANASRFGSDFTYLKNVIFTCDEGYHTTDLTTIVCQSDGKWSSKLPICQKITCSELTNPLNGLVNYPNLDYNSEAIYTCNEGYELIGNEKRICKGTWTGEQPICKEINLANNDNLEEDKTSEEKKEKPTNDDSEKDKTSDKKENKPIKYLKLYLLIIFIIIITIIGIIIYFVSSFSKIREKLSRGGI